MKKKIVLVLSMFVVAMMIGNAMHFSMQNQKMQISHKYMPKIEAVKPLKPAPVKLQAKAKFFPAIPKAKTTDIQVSTGEGTDQNPAIVTDGKDILTLYETEVDTMDYDIGIANSLDKGNTWAQYSFQVDGSPEQPRLDLYYGTQAYGTWTADPIEASGKSYIAMFPDITDPQAGNGWSYAYIDWGTYDIGVPFTSADVSCYKTDNPPSEAFWGIVGHTGDNEYSGYEEDNTFMFEYETQQDYFTIIFFYNMDEDVYNISTTIDQSNGEYYMAADFTNETDPSIYGIYLLVSPPITSDENWWQADWPGIIFYNASHPSIAAANGKVYIATELKKSDGSTDIVCFVSDNPSVPDSWNMYNVTVTSGIDEKYPVISLNGGNPVILFVKSGTIYESQSKDGGATWSQPTAVNDGNSAISQYGCVAMDYPYGVWTDSRNGNYDIYFDTVELAPIFEITPHGGFGIKADVSNIGTAAAENVPWSIDVSGVFIGKHAEGTLNLQPGESITIKDPFVIGFGSIEITIKVGSTTKTAKGFALGPLVLGVK